MRNMERNNHQSVDEEEDSPNKRTLWIGGGITSQVDEEMLFEMFNNAGPVEDVRIPMDRERNQSKNFAFVTFHHEESLGYAISLFDRIRLFGKELIIKQAGRSSAGKLHSRSISAPGIHYQNNHSPYNIPPSRQRNNNDYYQPQYDNQQDTTSYSSRRDERYHGNNNYSTRNSYHQNDRRDRRYDRRSYEYDRYRR